MSYYSSRSTQYALYYLFMMADGEITPSEQDRLDQLAKAEKLPKAIQKKILEKYSTLSVREGQDNSAKVIAAMTKLLASPDENEFEDEWVSNWFDKINDRKYLQWQTLWRMLTLAYADIDYSEPEKKVIAFLQDYWEIGNDLPDEMLDTANTMLALTKQKEWWKTSGASYDDIARHLAEIDKTIERLYQSMDDSITEASIVERS